MQQAVRHIAVAVDVVVTVVAGHGSSGQEVADKPAPFPTIKAVRNTSCTVYGQAVHSTC
jgi:hypothetical protein